MISSSLAARHGDYLDEVKTLLADELYTIPMEGTHVRSLNLSNAAAIVLYEARRQLGKF